MKELARSVGRDVRHGIRLWRNSPGVSLVALLSLMLSIGAATAVFTFFDVLLLRPLPVRAPGELYAVGPASSTTLDVTPLYVSYMFYKQLREDPVFAQLVASSTVVSSGVNLAASGSTERVRVELVSGNYFGVLGVAPSIGRAILDPARQDPPIPRWWASCLTQSIWIFARRLVAWSTARTLKRSKA